MHFITVLISFLFIVETLSYNYSSINLPDIHIPYYFSMFPNVAEECSQDPECPYKEYLNDTSNKCWGYEYNCKWKDQYLIPSCPGDHKGWVKSKSDQEHTFYTQADFGYIGQQLREMRVMCEPLFPDDSSLECSEHLRFCRGRNLMLNFTSLLSRSDPIRYKMDVLKEGEVGGYCDFQKPKLDAQADHVSPLQSWAPELRYFTKLNRRPILEGDCDVVIEKPTFIMKIDASMYSLFYRNVKHLTSINSNTHYSQFILKV